jgi:hypothetical protein
VIRATISPDGVKHKSDVDQHNGIIDYRKLQNRKSWKYLRVLAAGFFEPARYSSRGRLDLDFVLNRHNGGGARVAHRLPFGDDFGKHRR